MHVKIMITKMSSELKHVINCMVPFSRRSGGDRRRRTRRTYCVTYRASRQKGKWSTEREEWKRYSLCRKTRCACAHCEKNPHTVKNRINKNERRAQLWIRRRERNSKRAMRPWEWQISQLTQNLRMKTWSTAGMSYETAWCQRDRENCCIWEGKQLMALRIEY